LKILVRTLSAFNHLNQSFLKCLGICMAVVDYFLVFSCFVGGLRSLDQ
jgi:hypothetical protein